MNEQKRIIVTVIKDGRRLSFGMKLTDPEKKICDLLLRQLVRFNYLYKYEMKEAGANGDF